VSGEATENRRLKYVPSKNLNNIKNTQSKQRSSIKMQGNSRRLGLAQGEWKATNNEENKPFVQ
jgi:hypothetical protein